MKITKARLKQIIKEERDAYLPQMGGRISPKEGAAELRKDIEELMGSILFSKADPKDKRGAAKKIYSALIRTSYYGGENTFYEEILDDALGGYGSDLQQRLADAAGAGVDSWGEALSAWASGEEDFESYANPDYEDDDIGSLPENKMKLTKARLQQIIKEEIRAVTEAEGPEKALGRWAQMFPDAVSALKTMGVTMVDILDALGKDSYDPKMGVDTRDDAEREKPVPPSSYKKAGEGPRFQENKTKLTKARLQEIIKEEVDAATEQKAIAKIDELMASALFSNADEADKAEARSIILDALMGLEGYGGTRRPDEEYMDDAFREPEKTALAIRLADASPAAKRSYWLDALVAWSLGRKDYEKLLDDDEELS